MLFVYKMTDKYFLNTCSGRQCFLIANQIAHSSMSDGDQLHHVTTQSWML